MTFSSQARTASAAETQALARALAGVCRAGDIVVLAGEMGAGKTAFAQGFAAGLGIEEAVMLVEWGDAVLPALGDRYLEVRITFGDGDDDRSITLLPRGTSWSARSRLVAQTVAPWAVTDGDRSC